jgi:hypothetical protein
MAWHRYLLGALLGLTAAAPAAAWPLTVLTPKYGKVDNLVPVPAPSACWVALSENLGLLAFCHEREYQDAQVSLVRLDAKGNPAAYATSWKLPKPAELAKVPTYALSAAFHPKLPLLYVWHDVTIPFPNPPTPEPPALKTFDRLFIYNVAKDPPELLVSVGRGPDYVWGQGGGAVAVDPAGEYLYVPNLRDPKTLNFLRYGRFRLDAAGLPYTDEKDAKLPLAARAKRLAELNAVKPLVPAQQPPIEYVNLMPWTINGTGQSYFFASRGAIVLGGYNGLMTWRPDDKTCALSGLALKYPGTNLVSGHPTLPILFVTSYEKDSIFRVSHSEGYLSLLPHQVTFANTSLTSPPAILAKARKLAVGGHYHVYVASLDEESQVLPEVIKTRVLCSAVRALVCSERFDRLYVGVEVSK